MQKNSFFLLLVGISLFLISFPVWGEEKIIQGVTLRGQELGGKGYNEFLEIINYEEENLLKKTVTFDMPLESESQKITLTYQELGIQLNSDLIWNEAILLGRSGNWWQRIWARWKIKREGYNLPLFFHIDQKKVQNELTKQTASWKIEPENAFFEITKADKVMIIAEKYGKDVDMMTLFSDLEERVHKAQGREVQCPLYFRIIRPEKTKEDLDKYQITGVISQFNTQFNPGRISRTQNIRVASKALDGYIIAPGEIFSFNQVVGPRSKERGYDEADVILSGELVSGVGGGVCQVSTTLYNAVLRAELQIVERLPHSLLIPYIAPGLDATVAYGSIDLKFKNTLNCYILIKSVVQNGVLTFKLFGQAKKTGEKVVIQSYTEKTIEPKTIFREDPLVPKGRYILDDDGKPGFIIRVERLVYNSQGKLLRKEVISRDTYPPKDRVIRTLSLEPLLSNYDNL